MGKKENTLSEARGGEGDRKEVEHQQRGCTPHTNAFLI
jgi:hypothetical protein